MECPKCNLTTTAIKILETKRSKKYKHYACLTCHYQWKIKRITLKAIYKQINQKLATIIQDITQKKKLTVFHGHELDWKAMMELLTSAPKTSKFNALIVHLAVFEMILKQIVEILVENPHITENERHEFLTGFVRFLTPVQKHLKKEKKRLIAITMLQNFVFYWIRSRRRKMGEKMPLIESIMCSFTPENQRQRTLLLDKYKAQINRVIEIHRLKREDVLLVFVKRRLGCVGAVLLLADLVNQTGLNACTINMHIQAPNAFGEIPTNRDCILIYDEDATGHEITEIQESIDRGGGRYHATIVLWKDQSDTRENVYPLFIEPIEV